MSRVVYPYKLTEMSMLALRHIYIRNDFTQQELSDQFGLSPQEVFYAVKGLKRNQLLVEDVEAMVGKHMKRGQITHKYKDVPVRRLDYIIYEAQKRLTAQNGKGTKKHD